VATALRTLGGHRRRGRRLTMSRPAASSSRADPGLDAAGHSRSCPQLEEIAAFVDGTLSLRDQVRLVRLMAHLILCNSCYKLSKARLIGHEKP
jgi:hypothetical protein